MYKATAADIQKLREMTDAGMMDCKKALEETGATSRKLKTGSRKKGIAKAAKREDREAKEGVVVAKTNASQTQGIVIALNCETDFVARNDNFVNLANKIADIALEKFPATLADLLALSYEGGVTIGDNVAERDGLIGEEVELSRYEPLYRKLSCSLAMQLQ
jgi:elongation factor Ts